VQKSTTAFVLFCSLAALAQTVNHGIFTLQCESMVAGDVTCNLVHEVTVKVDNAAAIRTLQMQMGIAVMTAFNKLIRRLLAMFSRIFHDITVFFQFIQIAVDGGHIYRTIQRFHMVVDVFDADCFRLVGNEEIHDFCSVVCLVFIMSHVFASSLE
jgi:hypothetical protein